MANLVRSKIVEDQIGQFERKSELKNINTNIQKNKKEVHY